MFEVNLLSSDDVTPAIATQVQKSEPEIIDLLSSSPIRTPPAWKQNHTSHINAEPETPPQDGHSGFELSSSPILKAREPNHQVENNAFELSSSPNLERLKSSILPLKSPVVDTETCSNNYADTPQGTEVLPSASQNAAKRAFRSSTDVIAPKPKSSSKKFKATKTSSAPAAVKLITDRKKACDGIICSIWDFSGGWTELLSEALKTLEINVPCNSVQAPAELEGVEAVVTVSGEFSDLWDEEQHVFVKAAAHTEFMDMHIVVLQAEQLNILGEQVRENRDIYFQHIRDSIAKSRRCDSMFNIVFVVPEIHVQFRKMIAAYDRRLRQRVVDHSNGRDIEVEQPPPQHYFNDVQVRLQVENQIRAVYPRTKVEAAETIANWIIDMCFARYRMRTDAIVEGIGGSVKSKTAVPEITAEALAVVYGLPPRIASSIAGDMKSVGKLCTLLDSNAKQQMARLKYYGKGDWNESLITLLTGGDPEQTIGQI